jgi:hypothetical protein
MLLAIAFAWAASWAVTLAWSATMTSMPGMPMPWLPMPGQTWFEVITSYLGMWALTVRRPAAALAITLERLLPHGERASQVAGLIAIGAGCFVLVG